MASLDEQEGRVHPEDGRVGKLELNFFLNIITFILIYDH